MASGDTLIVFTPLHGEPSASNYATFDKRNNHLVLDFDPGTDETIYFGGILPRNYGGGGITVTLIWLATSATSGDVVWAVAFERHQDETTDLDSDDFAADQTVTATAPGTNGTPQYSAIAFTNGAQIDSLAVGESFRLRVVRDADNGSDTMTGDAELLRVELRET
jgi:hypothetical protein